MYIKHCNPLQGMCKFRRAGSRAEEYLGVRVSLKLTLNRSCPIAETSVCPKDSLSPRYAAYGEPTNNRPNEIRLSDTFYGRSKDWVRCKPVANLKFLNIFNSSICSAVTGHVLA